ncbi:NfeD family protein [Microbacterium hominis]|uniref:NfeD family protein n=1 Tax=Microbacterium hominis TaxID=162426 RepID=A0A7D4UBG8_9MICO|nr:NfeD family protein [Microbacterium hominis]QKJ19543.1 NfeD family protein [Microbacterium hominis]
MLPDLTEYMWILWLSLALLFVIIELLTLEFTFLMLAVGSLIGGLGVNLLGGPWWLQIGAAAVLSALLLFTIRPLLLRVLRKSSRAVATNVDAIYGMGGRVVAPFVDGAGSVKLDNGETWTARLGEDLADGDAGVGTRVTVSAVLGATVEVAPAARPAPAEPPRTDTPPKERTTDDG